jgi:hypothetical protein
MLNNIGVSKPTTASDEYESYFDINEEQNNVEDENSMSISMINRPSEFSVKVADLDLDEPIK